MPVIDLTFTKSLDALGRAVERARTVAVSPVQSSRAGNRLAVASASILAVGVSAQEMQESLIEHSRSSGIAASDLLRGSYFAKRPEEMNSHPRPYKRRSR